MVQSQVDLKGKHVREPLIPVCAFPKCTKKSVDEYHGFSLCAQHLHWAEFLEWYLKELMDKVGTARGS